MLSHDVVIVGGGLAGLMAALSVDPRLSLAVVSRVHPLRSHSVAAQGGINAALGNDPEGRDDTWEKHAFDTIKGSDFLADQDAAELMCRLAAPAILRARASGRSLQPVPGRRDRPAAVRRRGLSADVLRGRPHRARHPSHSLRAVGAAPGSRSTTKSLVTSSWSENGRCHGLIVFDLATGEILPMRAPGGHLRHRRLRPDLSQLDQCLHQPRQRHRRWPTGPASRSRTWSSCSSIPRPCSRTNILITEGARGEGGYLLDNQGRRFMADYAPTAMELAPRDIVARAIQTEIDKGNGFEHGYVHLDLRHLGEKKIHERLPSASGRSASSSPASTRSMSRSPSSPASITRWAGSTSTSGCATSLRFYAAGECACVSVHGANRLGGNSLLDTVVFGKIAGESASAFVQGSREQAGDEKTLTDEAAAEKAKVGGWLARSQGFRAHHLLNNLKVIMSEKVGLFRTRRAARGGPGGHPRDPGGLRAGVCLRRLPPVQPGDRQPHRVRVHGRPDRGHHPGGAPARGDPGFALPPGFRPDGMTGIGSSTPWCRSATAGRPSIIAMSGSTKYQPEARKY